MPTREERERDKYERMAATPGYKGKSVGVRHVADAIGHLDIPRGADVVDLGCGTGLAMDAFLAKDIYCDGVDITPARLECRCVPERAEFIEGPLWAIDRTDGWWDYGFCADVMEHIPPEKVDDVLAEIKRVTLFGVYFAIATRPDKCGRAIGETLHLTVRDADWWRSTLESVWDEVREVRRCRGSVVFVVRD